MDGNVTWTDTELDANVGFSVSFFKKKILVGQKKTKILAFKGDEPWSDRASCASIRDFCFGSCGQCLLGHQFNNEPL